VTIPPGGAEGVLLANGGAAGGFVLYVKDGRLQYTLNYVAKEFFTVSSVDIVPERRHKVRFDFGPTGEPDFTSGKGAPGRFQLYIDGSLAGETDVPYTTPNFYELEGMSCGYDSGTPVLADVYRSPFTFSGTVHEVVVDLAGELIEDEEATRQRLMAQQ
jgi:hypothetical protein